MKHFEEEVELLTHGAESRRITQQSRHGRKIHVIGFLLLTFGSLIGLVVGYVCGKESSTVQCVKKTSSYSPLLEVVEYEEVTFKGAFDQPSIYRGPPSTDVEDAWDGLWKHGFIDVKKEAFSLLNMSDPDRYKRSSSGGFHTIIDVYHQLHCLNMVRQYTWLDHYKTPPEDFLYGEVATRMHVDHCIDSLRQYLMCTADVTPVFLELKPDTVSGARGDFSTFHKCRNFEKLTKWLDDNLSPDFVP